MRSRSRAPELLLLVVLITLAAWSWGRLHGLHASGAGPSPDPRAPRWEASWTDELVFSGSSSALQFILYVERDGYRLLQFDCGSLREVARGAILKQNNRLTLLSEGRTRTFEIQGKAGHWTLREVPAGAVALVLTQNCPAVRHLRPDRALSPADVLSVGGVRPGMTVAEVTKHYGTPDHDSGWLVFGDREIKVLAEDGLVVRVEGAQLEAGGRPVLNCRSTAVDVERLLPGQPRQIREATRALYQASFGDRELLVVVGCDLRMRPTPDDMEVQRVELSTARPDNRGP